MRSSEQTSPAPTPARRIVIIGAGPGGMVAAIKLLEAGYDNFVIIEKSGGFGGTWYNTRYPGLTCDVKSRLYSFSFEPNPRWSRAYAPQPEILEYMQKVARKYGLEPFARFNTKVTAARWDEDTSTWRLATDTGEQFEADVVIAAPGMFNDLKWPDINGLADFQGTMFHAARWDTEHSLHGERVAVIGSAASAIQFVPEIAPDTARLSVFQRSAAWVGPKDDPAVEAAEMERLANDPLATTAARDALLAELEGRITFSNPEMLAAATQAGLQNIALVNDSELRKKLTPDAPFGCVRPLTSNKYYPMFNEEHVELVTEPIERVTATGIVTTDATVREFDTIICATGYHVRRFVGAIDVTGRDGLNINDAWKDHPEAYLGLLTTGFPNLFMMYGPNTNNGSLLYMLETQARFIVDRLGKMDRDGVTWVDVRREVMDAYNEALQADLEKVGVWQASCSNYYRAPSGRIVTQWPHTMSEYERRCEAVDDSDFETDRTR